MLCMERLRYNWFLWFGFKNKRRPMKHPMQHILSQKDSRNISIDENKFYYKKSKFEIANPK